MNFALDLIKGRVDLGRGRFIVTAAVRQEELMLTDERDPLHWQCDEGHVWVR
jgi:hypothetical protein